MSRSYYIPHIELGAPRSDAAIPLAGGAGWFVQAEQRKRAAPPKLLAAQQLPADLCAALSQPRPPICGLSFARPRIMGILNITPDSFSDGGQWADQQAVIARAQAMVAAGCDILDIGGESTRPGADFVPIDAEIARVVPVITALREAGISSPISIDTRKPQVAEAAINAGANIWNDVTALTFDPTSLAVAVRLNCPVCLMHAQGDPKTMQKRPNYADVLLDIYDYLQERQTAFTQAGGDPHQAIIDPGIGFGKRTAHNLDLIRHISIFHGLGAPILLGASRKGFIGEITGEPDPARRAPGSIAIALAALYQGVQIVRVHDVRQTAQAVAMWSALWQPAEA